MPRSGPLARHLRQPLRQKRIPAAALPRTILDLADREKQVAAVVYEQGGSTARSVEEALNFEVGNSAVRSMLTRLVRKGVLTREFRGRGQGQASLYLPAITIEDVGDDAIDTICRRYFDGSLQKLAMRALELSARRPNDTRPSAK